jgi:RimJ/RimL family protein N-acetyltransferase
VAEFRPLEVPLTGQRVRLRPFRVADAADIVQSCQDPDIPRFTMMPEHMTEARAREWVERRLELWSHGLFSMAITMPPDDRCVGQVGVSIDERLLRAETFYWLDRRARGLGVAAEALDVVTRWAFDEHEVVRAQLITHLDNQASQRVAQRCGYQREGVLRAWEPIKDDRPDVVMWSRLASDPAPDLDRSAGHG